MVEALKTGTQTPELLNGVGEIKIITGPMFCGKSEELIRRLRNYEIAIGALQRNGRIETVDLSERIMVFKPTIDDRRGNNTINTNNGYSYPALSINKAEESLAKVTENTIVVAFDESQFWSADDLVNTSRELVRLGKKIEVSGLGLDFRGETWGGISILVDGGVEDPLFLKAICTICGGAAIFSQRIVEEEISGETVRRPARYDEPIEVIGGTNLYEARCRRHHEVPGKPEK